MTERRRRSPRKGSKKQPSGREQILAAIAREYDDRQWVWSEELDYDLPDWELLLELHLQLSELEHMVETLEELR